MNLRRIAVSVLCVSLLAMPVRGVAMTTIERLDRYVFSFDNDETFAGAIQHIDTVFTLLPVSQGEVVARTFSIQNSVSTNIQWVGDEHLLVDVTNIAAGNPTVVSASISSIDGEPGMATLSYDRPRTSTIENGVHVFRRTGVGGFGGVSPGFPFVVEVVLPGDWSGTGTGPGQHQLIELNPLWSIDRDFEFDGASTVFRAHIAQYTNDGLHDADLSYVLYGVAAVPEPSAWLLMLLGVGFVAGQASRACQRFHRCSPYAGVR